MFFDILKVGAVSCLSPLQTVLTILIFTKILAGFGTETLAGYGMGSRLEFLLTPIAFAFGVASVPMVGMAMGAGLVARARRVAWTAGAAAGLIVGADRPDRCGQAVALGLAVHQRSRRHRRGLFLFRLGRPGVRLLRAGRVPLFLLARRGEGRRARCWPAPRRLLLVGARRLVAGLDRARRPGPCLRWSAPRWSCYGLGTALSIRADALGQMIARRCATDVARIRFVVMQACFFEENSWPADLAFIIAIATACSAAPSARAQARRADRHLADPGGRRPGAGQQMRRRHLRGDRRAEENRSIPPPASRRSMTRIPIRRCKAPDDRPSAVQRHAALGPGKWSGQIYNADDGGTYASNVSVSGRIRCGSKAASARSAAARPGPASGR